MFENGLNKLGEMPTRGVHLEPITIVTQSSPKAVEELPEVRHITCDKASQLSISTRTRGEELQPARSTPTGFVDGLG